MGGGVSVASCCFAKESDRDIEIVRGETERGDSGGGTDKESSRGKHTGRQSKIIALSHSKHYFVTPKGYELRPDAIPLETMPSDDRMRTALEIVSRLGELNYPQRVEGEWEELGPIRLSSGEIYKGEWDRGLFPQGRGKKIWPDGSLFEGQFIEGKACGWGRLVKSNGDVYVGEWKDDMANGRGTFTSTTSGSYQGEWIDNMKEGEGREVGSDGSIYKGRYSKGKKSGKGELEWPNGNKYKGDFTDDKMEGIGTYTWKDGKKYEGQWVNDQMKGVGKFIWPDGRVYEGQFDNDLRHGKGIFLIPYANNSRIEGDWNKGNQVGECKFSSDNFEPSVGLWVNGVFKKWINDRDDDASPVKRKTK